MAVPDIARPPDRVIDAVEEHFEENEQHYAKIWERLDEVNTQYQLSTREERICMLKLSYINSVFSIRTPVHIHEEAFERFVGGEPMKPAMKNAGMGLVDHSNTAKHPMIHETLADASLWDEVETLISDGNVDSAHKLLLDRAGWLGTAKAPFTLANLGFVQKMCVDGNVAGLFKIEEHPQTAVVARYEGLCADIRSMFPELAGRLRPYELQWLLFDWQRMYDWNGEITRDGNEPITQHDIWFDTVLGDFHTACNAVRRETMRARGIDPDRPEPQPIEDEIESAIYDAVGDKMFREFAEAGVQEKISDAVEDALAEVNGEAAGSD